MLCSVLSHAEFKSCHRCCAAVQSVYLGLLTASNMEVLFCNVLYKLGVSLGGNALPAHITLMLKYIDGVPRRLQLLFAALAESDDGHEFQKSKLLLGLCMAKEHPERFCCLLCVHHCARFVPDIYLSAPHHHPARFLLRCAQA